MPSNKINKRRKITLELSKANAELAGRVARILKTTVERVVSLCLSGSTNP
jgi:hypothetical protein